MNRTVHYNLHGVRHKSSVVHKTYDRSIRMKIASNHCTSCDNPFYTVRDQYSRILHNVRTWQTALCRFPLPTNDTNWQEKKYIWRRTTNDIPQEHKLFQLRTTLKTPRQGIRNNFRPKTKLAPFTLRPPRNTIYKKKGFAHADVQIGYKTNATFQTQGIQI